MVFGFIILANMWSPVHSGASLEYGLYLSTFSSSVRQIYLDTEFWLNICLLDILVNRKMQEGSRKTFISALLTMPKPLTVWITTICGKFLKRWDYKTTLTCLLRNLYVGQEATLQTRHGKTDWFQIEKEVHQGCILSPCLFNFYVEYIMRNTGLDEVQAGIKIFRRNTKNLRYADDTTLMAESEEELKCLLMKVKEESKKVGLKLNI